MRAKGVVDEVKRKGGEGLNIRFSAKKSDGNRSEVKEKGISRVAAGGGEGNAPKGKYFEELREDFSEVGEVRVKILRKSRARKGKKEGREKQMQTQCTRKYM